MSKTALRRSRRRGREGMTLVEIMIVVIIMALIATAVGIAVLPMLESSRVKQATTDVAGIRGAAVTWFAGGHADCPSVSDRIDEGILDRHARDEDPWGSAFVIECEDADVDVISAGPDRELGTSDDIPQRGS